MHLKSFYVRCWERAEKIVMCALSAKKIGYLEDHFIESVTQNWHYFRFSPSSSPCETEPYNKCLSYFLLLIMNVLAEYRIELMQGKTVLFPLLQLIVKRAREEGSFFYLYVSTAAAF